MKEEIDTILYEFTTEMESFQDERLDDYSNVELGIKIARKYIQKLRIVLRQGSFINKENEIHFFKKQKPFIYSQLKFYAKLYKYLLQKPRGTDKSKRIYIDAEIQKIQDYYYQNGEFIKYYRQNATFLDDFYFLRGNDNIGLLTDTSHFYTDIEFSTSHDSTVAKIMAYDLLLLHYTDELKNMKKLTKKSLTNQKILEDLKLTWTSNKIDLVELTYALIASGSVKGDIKDLATLFEKAFDVDLGNYYRSFLEIRGRKEDPTRFINMLRQTLNKKIEESDE